MSGFLDEMARLSNVRAAQARAAEPLAALEKRAKAAARGPRLVLSDEGFDVIAELKLKSPAAGRLGAQNEDWLKRVTAYAQGGAAAVSVLTEPSRFDGSLEHLRQASAALRAVQGAHHAQGFPGGSLPGARGARGRRRRRPPDRENVAALAAGAAARCSGRTGPVRAARGVRRRRLARCARTARCAHPAPSRRRQG